MLNDGMEVLIQYGPECPKKDKLLIFLNHIDTGKNVTGKNVS